MRPICGELIRAKQQKAEDHDVSRAHPLQYQTIHIPCRLFDVSRARTRFIRPELVYSSGRIAPGRQNVRAHHKHMPIRHALWGKDYAAHRKLLVDTPTAEPRVSPGAVHWCAKALAVVDRVVRGAHKHANARRTGCRSPGQNRAQRPQWLPSARSMGIAQATGVRDNASRRLP